MASVGARSALTPALSRRRERERRPTAEVHTIAAPPSPASGRGLRFLASEASLDAKGEGLSLFGHRASALTPALSRGREREWSPAANAARRFEKPCRPLARRAERARVRVLP
ncbi:hypothetical protein GGQ63_004078 [Prosthecomicrobium pneumaticum]|uniref:Uncharacterized protein n=1 Tax=Prosthecomicrobium pneumaticum TaxID=81895 RepID=A0A7W9FQM0_9HYPH|nr:hypothetical protein [Prosthecomicrobium pneumaticum]